MAPRDIDSLLPQLLAFPPHPPVPLVDVAYDKEIKGLRKVLNDTPASLLTAGVPSGGDLLDILDPSINTLPFLYVLLAHSNAGKQKATTIGSPLWHKAVDFLHRFDSVQVRYVGTEFRRLVMFVKDVALAGKKPIAAVRPLGSAILRLDPTGSCFTSTHLAFVQICLEAHTFDAARPVIDKDIYELPSSAKTVPDLPCSRHDTSSGFITDKSDLSETVTYREPLLYFLYGAMIYLALKEWRRAILYLEVVLTAPSKTQTSQIQVEAYKKWVLANLLAYGEVPNSLPKTTSSQVVKNVRTVGKPYEALALIFQYGIANEHDVRRLNAEVHVGHQRWSSDHNVNLVLQVLDAYRQFTIAKLELTYVALPLSEVGQRTSPNPNDHAETAQYITGMIHSGQLNATVEERGNDQGSWVLRFTTSTSRSEQYRHEELKRQVAKTAKVAEHVRETDRKLSLNKDYITWLKQKAEMSTAAANTAEDPGVMTFDNNGFEDEDLLVGM
ncbi:MAG: hypothetical protein Q9169_002728 [Polycauliona sp. 2 TL-2023]